MAYNVKGYSPRSDTWAFWLSNPLSTAVQTYLPEGSLTDANFPFHYTTFNAVYGTNITASVITRPAFTWQKDPDAYYYMLTVQNVDTGVNVIRGFIYALPYAGSPLDCSIGNVCVLTPAVSTNLGNGTFKWWVQPYTLAGWRDASSPKDFSISTSTVGLVAPTMLAVTGGSTVTAGNSIFLTWRNEPGNNVNTPPTSYPANRYDVEIYDSLQRVYTQSLGITAAALGSANCGAVGGICTWNPSPALKLTTPGQYTWRVRANYANVRRGPWSNW